MKHRIVMFMLLSIVAITPVIAQEDTTEIAPALVEQMDQLVAYTEQIRGLETQTFVERAFPTREDTIAYLSSLYDEQLPQEEFDRLTAFYVALGLLPPDIDLREVYLNLLGSQVAGFYDTDTQIMNVLPYGADGETLGLSEQIIFVHEYTHALQDQYFDLDTLMGSDADIENPDAALAAIGLVEGDATAVMNIYTQGVTTQNPLSAFALLAESLQAGNLTLPPGVPDILLRELLFPYEAGFGFVQALYQNGEWAAVDAAYQNLPTTTEQILHPEKYFAGEGAQTDALIALDYTEVLPDWTVLYQDTPIGEFYIREVLRAQLSSSIAENGAAGWGGDAFTLLQDPESGDLAWRLTIQWDTLDDAGEFLAAYTELATARYNVEGSDGCHDGGDLGASCVRATDQVVTIIAAPSRDILSTMMNAE